MKIIDKIRQRLKLKGSGRTGTERMGEAQNDQMGYTVGDDLGTTGKTPKDYKH